MNVKSNDVGGLRVRRGMVFSYDINPKIDKFNPPKLFVGGALYSDHLQYGVRDWLVVSSDVNNRFSGTVNIVPITGQTKINIPANVCFTYDNKSLTILATQVRTVNIVELQNSKYRYFVDDSVMDRVSRALAAQFAIPEQYKYTKNLECSLDTIEAFIDGIIRKKVEEHTPVKANEVDIEDAFARIENKLKSITIKENTSNTEPAKKETIKKEPEGQIDKFYSKYPGIKKIDTEKGVKRTKSTEPVKSYKPRKTRTSRKWTEDSMREFLRDYNTLSVDEVAKRWEFDDRTQVSKTLYYVNKKLEVR